MKIFSFKRAFVLWLLSFFLFPIQAQRITVSGTQFEVNGNRIWLNGANTPWDKWNDIGGNYNHEFWSNHFATLKLNHINSTRVWVACDGAGAVQIQSDGYVVGPTEKFWSDMDDLMSIAQTNEIYLMVALISFDHTKKGNVNYKRWKAMYNNEANRKSFVENYAIPFTNRYGSNPYFFAIDVGNELDNQWDFQHSVSHQGPVDLITKVATAVHATKTGVLVCQGLGQGIKYNTSAHNGKGNYFVNCGVDFWNIHYYDWMNSKYSNPFTLSPTDYDLNDKPCIIGEFPAKGVSGFTPEQCYANLFANEYQGAMMWTSNGVDKLGTYLDAKAGVDYIYDTYPLLVYPPLF